MHVLHVHVLFVCRCLHPSWGAGKLANKGRILANEHRNGGKNSLKCIPRLSEQSMPRIGSPLEEAKSLHLALDECQTSPVAHPKDARRYIKIRRTTTGERKSFVCSTKGAKAAETKGKKPRQTDWGREPGKQVRISCQKGIRTRNRTPPNNQTNASEFFFFVCF